MNFLTPEASMMAANSIDHCARMAAESARGVDYERTRPSVLYQPKLSIDV